MDSNNNNYLQPESTLPEPYYPNPLAIVQQPCSPPSKLLSQENHKHYQYLKEFKEGINNNIDSKMLSVQLSEFQISPKSASNMFESWINSLWFTPTGFKKLIDTNHLKKVYIPFYSFKINYNVEFSGFVTYDSKLNCTNSFNFTKEQFNQPKQQQQQKSSNSNNKPITILTKDGELNSNNNHNLPTNFEELIKDKNIKWNKVDGYITRTVNRILLLACNSLNISDKDDKDNNNNNNNNDENSINHQNIMNCMNNYQQQFDFNDTIEKTLEDFKLFAQLEQAEIQSRYEPEIVWKRDYLNYLLEKEQSMSVQYLKQQEQSLFVRNVSSNIQFNEKLFTLVYIPFYYTQYQYQSQSFSFFLNAQNGTISATRPDIGLGKFGDVLKYTHNYISTLFGHTEPLSKTKGDDLSDIDQNKVYNIINYYLCFTRSSTNLLWTGSSIGYLVIKNNSKTQSAILRGQKRRSIVKGNIFTLAPLAERTFSFKGHWCLEIIEGDVNSIDIVKINPRDGGNNFQSIKN